MTPPAVDLPKSREPSLWNRPLPRIRIPIAGHEAQIILGLGILCRVAQYLSGRSLWLDEGSLADNIRHKTLAGLFGPLEHTQLAPPGFLVVEWAAAHILGGGVMALRLFPLICGIAALVLFRRLATRTLSPRAALIALALFAVSDDLIYYASELKQYSTDVALTVATLLVGLSIAATPLTLRRFLAYAAFGASALWFSHPVLFVMAGVGVVPLVSSLAHRQWKRAGALALLALVCAGSFAAMYRVSLNQLADHQGMWVFWWFSFPPIPLRSVWDATWVVRRFFYLFVNPLDFSTPLGPRLSAVVPCLLFLWGGVSIARRDRVLFGMLTLPILFAVVAAYLRLFPFHGRLILYLVPVLLLFIAEGAGKVRQPALRAIVLATLLLCPALSAAYHLASPRLTMEFNPHGDRRPAALDPNRFPF